MAHGPTTLKRTRVNEKVLNRFYAERGCMCTLFTDTHRLDDLYTVVEINSSVRHVHVSELWLTQLIACGGGTVNCTCV